MVAECDRTLILRRIEVGNRPVAPGLLEQDPVNQLPDRLFDLTGVGNHELSGGSFSIKRPLARFPAAPFVESPVSRGSNPGKAGFGRNIDKHHRVGEVTPIAFQQDGGVEQDGLAFFQSASVLNLLLNLFLNHGMDNLFELIPANLRVRVGAEDQPTHGGPVNPAVV